MSGRVLECPCIMTRVDLERLCICVLDPFYDLAKVTRM